MVEAKHVLATAIETFEEQKQELLRTDEGRWVLIRETAVHGVYDRREQALHAGYEAFPGRPFLVRQILMEQEPLTARPIWIPPA